MADIASKKATIWTPANIVTCIRVVFVPVWLLLAELLGGTGTGGIVVFVAFCLLSLTDKLDGYLARSRGEVTTFGKFLDPIADKLVVVVALSYLLELGWIPSWMLLVVVAREFLVSGLRMVVASGGIVVAASKLGKWKTATTMASICGLLLCIALVLLVPTGDTSWWGLVIGLYYVSYGLLLVAMVLTVWSGVDYFVKGWPALSRGSEFGDDAAQDEGPDVEAACAVGASEDVGAACVQDAEVNLAPSWEECRSRAAEVLKAARVQGLTLGTAESCTGGLVEGALTAIPGSSSVVKGAVGSYACSVKHGILGVSQEVLDTVGPVSPECAEQMAAGAREALGCDVAVSVTGIAGPGGEEPGKPVGFVWFGIATPRGVRSESVVFPGDRAEVRLQAVHHALGLLGDACM